MARVTIELDVIKDHCLGHEVFRGSAPAKELCAASWIDFHDPVSNRYGYQRPFDEARSAKAAEYAEKAPAGFWPECILSIRDNAETDESAEEVDFTFTPLNGTDNKFGKLSVTYSDDLTTMIDGHNEP